jgi:hypothetical protein
MELKRHAQHVRKKLFDKNFALRERIAGPGTTLNMVI